MAFTSTIFHQTTLYKYRFFIGYTLLLCILILILSIDLNTLPGGIAESGMHTAVQSQTTGSLDSVGWIINAPFHALQKLSIAIFGVSRFALVIPSVLFGIATIILFMTTMRQWFRESIAVATTIIAVTTSPFIGMLRSANPEIMLSFWTMLFLYGAAKVLIKQQRAFGWKVLVAVASVGLLYTPLGIYPLLAFCIGGAVHPHVRSRFRRIALHRKLALFGIIVVLLVPLVFCLIREPNTWTLLLGWEQITQTIGDPQTTLGILFNLYANFANNEFVGTIVAPAFNVATVCLMLLGLFRAASEHHTARSYALLLWTGIVALVVLAVPYSAELVIMPALLLLALGLDTLIRYWYQLFPRNPYARAAGLVPLVILFISITTSNLTHYFYNQQYISTSLYRNSLVAVKESLKIEGDHPVTLVTTESTREFYALLQREYPKLTVISSPPDDISQPTLVVPAVQTSYGIPSRILTSGLKDDSATLRVYRPDS